MSHRRLRWSVTLKAPRPGHDGKNWLFRVRPPHGSSEKEKIWSSGTENRAEAEAKARASEDRLNISIATPLADPTFGEIYERHLMYRENDKDTAPNTRRGYRVAKPALSETVMWTTKSSSLDGPTVVLARDHLRTRLCASTANLYLNKLSKRAWTWAHERGLVARPWPKVKSLKTGPKRKRPYTDVEVAAVLEKLRLHSGGRWLPFFTLQADTAARINSICKLRGCDIDRERNAVFLRTKGKELWVAVPAETIALLPNVGRDEYVFTSSKGGPVDFHTPYQMLRAAIREAGIRDHQRLDSHSFRRRWISSAHRAGIPTGVAMQQTGHSSVAIHMGYQEGTVGDDLHAAVELVRSRRIGVRDPSQVSLPGVGVGAPPASPLSQKEPGQPVPVSKLLFGTSKNGAATEDARTSKNDPSRVVPHNPARVLGSARDFLGGVSPEFLDAVVALATGWPEEFIALAHDPERLGALCRAIRDEITGDRRSVERA